MSNSSIPIQLRRTQFLACMALSPRHSATSEYTQRHPPPAPPSSKDVVSPSSLQTHSPPLVLIPLPLWQHWLLRLLVLLQMAVYRRRRRWWNILEHHATRHVLALIPLSPPPVLHDTCPLGGKNHVHDSPASFAHGPVIQRPGSCHCPFNMSNGPSH